MIDPYRLLCKLDSLDPRQWAKDHLTVDLDNRKRVLDKNLYIIQFMLTVLDGDRDSLLYRKVLDILHAIEHERELLR